MRGALGRTLCRAHGGEMAPTGPGSRDNRGRGKEAKEVLTWRALSEMVDPKPKRKAVAEFLF